MCPLTHAHMHVGMHIFLQNMCIGMRRFVYIYIYVCTHIYIYIYIYSVCTYIWCEALSLVLGVCGLRDCNLWGKWCEALSLVLGVCGLRASYEKMGQYEIGIRYYTKASKIDQLYHQAWFGVGTCLAFKENWLEATHFFKKAIKIDPLNEAYLNSLAASEYSLGNSVSRDKINALEIPSGFF